MKPILRELFGVRQIARHSIADCNVVLHRHRMLGEVEDASWAVSGRIVSNKMYDDIS